MNWLAPLGGASRTLRAEDRSYAFGARGGPSRPPPGTPFDHAAPPVPELESRTIDPPPESESTLDPTSAPKPDPDAVPSAPTAAGPVSPPLTDLERTSLMSTDISATADISGFIGACLVDSDSGLMLASEGGGRIDMEAAAALNTQVVKAKLQAIDVLGLEDGIEDILITLGKQLHFIRPLEKSPSVFLYVALDKKGANLGMARMQVRKIESGLSL